MKGWRNRRIITTEVVDELSCFPEEGPFFDEGLRMITIRRRDCPSKQDCSYAPELRFMRHDLEALIKSLQNLTRSEDNRRRAALRVLYNTPRRQYAAKNCRALGDAYFALHCPSDAAILTSNAKDHEPLARAVNKTVAEYRWNQ